MRVSALIGLPAASLLITAAQAGNPFATITPCPGCMTELAPPPITVTAQYQPVSTCVATFTRCTTGDLCETSYSYSEWDYVSTIIPCEYDGTTAATTTVTTTDQIVTISIWSTTITSYSTITTDVPWYGKGWKSGAHHGDHIPSTIVTTTVTPVTTVIAKDYCLPYSEIGSWAIPGYPGSGLCDDCSPHNDGSSWQALNVTECMYSPAGYKCVQYPETWVSSPAPTTTSATTATCNSRLSAPSAGTWTWTFPFSGPAPTATGGSWNYDPQPWNWEVTKTCNGPQWWDYTTTVTTTITYTVPPTTQSAQTSWSVPFPTTGHAGFPADPSFPGGEWEPWPTSTTSSSPSTPTGDTYIQVYDSGVKYRKGGPQYIGWSNDDGIVVTDLGSAAKFTVTDGVLTCDGGYVGSDLSNGFSPFEKFPSPPSTYTGWNFDGTSLTWGDYNFCVSGDNMLFVTMGGWPSFACKPVDLGCGDNGPPPSSTTTWSSTSSDPTWSTTGTATTWSTTGTATTWSTTSSWTPNPSSDPDPDMLEPPMVREREIGKPSRKIHRRSSPHKHRF